LGGTNLRVVSMTLDGHGGVSDVVELKSTIPDAVLTCR
jgi:hypothetical protein